jgi:hypothetical protein
MLAEKIRDIDVIGTDELRELLESTGGPCVSLFLPTERAGRETQQGPIRLRKLLSQIETDLKAEGLRWNESGDLLSPAADLLENSRFWMHQADGLAIFLAPGVFRSFRLPIDLPERAVVGERFDVKPLLPLFTSNGVFFLLALSENEVKLYECTRLTIHEMDLFGAPGSMSDALWADDREKQHQWHSRADSSPEGGGQAAMFYGTGDGQGMEQHKVNLKRYFDKVDRGLASLFKNSAAPLILTGVDYLLPIYRQANTSAKILEGEVHGNPERVPTDQLHAQAWPIAQKFFDSRREELIGVFHQLHGTGTASDDLDILCPAAKEGRVRVLFTCLDPRIDESGPTSRAEGDDRLNELATETLLKGGEVFALPMDDMPSESPVAGVLRY